MPLRSKRHLIIALGALVVLAVLASVGQAFEKSFQGMGWLLLIAVLVAYLAPGILYESFIHPLTSLSGRPAAGAGALLTLYLTPVIHLYLDRFTARARNEDTAEAAIAPKAPS